MAMRLGGLASGMDTDQMVKEMMKAESIKVDRVEAEKQLLEWKKESLNSLNKDLANFILDSKKDLGYNSVGRPGSNNWAKEATSTNENAGTAKAGEGAFEGKHTIKDIVLAKGVSGVSLQELGDTGKNWKAKGAFDFNINGKKVSVSDQDSLKTIARKINGANAGVQASYDENLGRFFISTEKEGSEAKIEFKNSVIVPKEGESLTQQQIDQNDANDVGLNNFLSTIELNIENGATGENGTANYNGLTVDLTSNQPTFNGVKFDIKTTDDFTINVKTDADAIVNKVKDFVANYNKLIEKANTLVKEKQNRNFRPLTPDQREAMSEKEVELWESKAKSGVARGDMDIEKMLSALRTDLYKNLEGASGKFKNISQIGITTQGYEAGSAGGKLQIDEDKLRKSIGEDADSVLEVLFKEKSSKPAEEGEPEATSNSLVGSSDKGLFSRIFDNITDGMKSIIEKSGPGKDSDLFRKVKSTIMVDFVTKGGKYSGKGSISDLDDDMTKFTKKIEDLKKQLLRRENMYYARFTAMEKAMQKANSQGDWLMGQMG